MVAIISLHMAAILFAPGASSLPKHNITINVPDGFSNQGEDDLFCVPTKWYHVFVFFAVNYLAHAVTVKTRPGQTWVHTTRDVILALAAPYFGLYRALETLRRSSWKADSDLTRAAKAGALCTVVKDKCNPQRSRCNVALGRDKRVEIATNAVSSTDSHRSNPVPSEVVSTVYGDNEAASRPQGRSQESIAMAPIGLANNAQTKGQLLDDDDNPHSSSAPESVENEGSLQKNVLAYDQPNARLRAENKSQLPQKPSTMSTILKGCRSIWCKGHWKYRHVHGVCKLPAGFHLAWVPPHATIVGPDTNDMADVTLCSSYNIPKALIGIVQTIYGSITLYRARGDQIDRYGYVSFGLTVIPYVVMSVMNLCCALVMPDYPTVYMVRSKEADMAIAAGARLDGVVGRLIEADAPRPDDGNMSECVEISNADVQIAEGNMKNADTTADLGNLRVDLKTHHRIHRPTDHNPVVTTSTYSCCLLLGAVPLAVISGLTRWRPGYSTKAERVWVMLWLVFDIVWGANYEGTVLNMDSSADKETYYAFMTQRSKGFWVFYLSIFLIIPAVGGFVTVGDMLGNYGTCTRMSGLRTS